MSTFIVFTQPSIKGSISDLLMEDLSSNIEAAYETLEYLLGHRDMPDQSDVIVGFNCAAWRGHELALLGYASEMTNVAAFTVGSDTKRDYFLNLVIALTTMTVDTLYSESKSEMTLPSWVNDRTARSAMRGYLVSRNPHWYARQWPDEQPLRTPMDLAGAGVFNA